MALLKVGKPLPLGQSICMGEECKTCRERLVPGQVVEVRIKVDPPITRERAFLLIKALSKIREKIPNAAFLYIEVSDDGKTVRVQISDDPPSFVSWATVAQIVIIIISIIALILAAKALIEAVYRVIPEPPSGRVAEVAWCAISIALAGLGIALAGYGISKVVEPWMGRRR